jgi:chromosome segregation ATPase
MKEQSTTEQIEQLRQALAQAHERASQAEAKVLESEAKAAEAETQIRKAEAKATEAETQIREAEAKVTEAEAKILEAAAKIQDLEQIRLDLEHQIQVLKRCLFGSRSEKISPSELDELIAEASQEAQEEILKAKRPDQPPAEAEEEKPEVSQSLPRSQRKARPHGRNRLPDHLPRRRIEHPIDPAQSRCPIARAIRCW